MAKKAMPKATKPKTVEQLFDEIAERAILEAERVPCSLSEFVEGLRSMRISIEDRHAMAADELKGRVD